jgi:3-hydroxypropanoate dehydrogenase
MHHHAVNDEALDRIFRSARSFNQWTDKPVSQALLMAVYDLTRLGPTSANCSPARFIFLTTTEAKERLAKYASSANASKIRSAPATAIIGYDLDFAQRLPKLFPRDQTAKNWFAKLEVEQATAFRNATLQGAYFMIATRALGLDCGPMSGFDNAKVDAEFFAGTRVKSNFICSVGYGDPAGLLPRDPRLDFDEACKLL